MIDEEATPRYNSETCRFGFDSPALMAAQLQLKLFGSPQIIYQGQPLTGFVSAKVRALLIYLAVTARPHSRDHLAELLWADTPASTRANLRKALSNLRQLIGDVLVEVAKDSIALKQSALWVDVSEFDRLLQQGAAEEAVALYQADFLTGFNLSLSYEFEAWALSEQSRAKAHLLALLRRLATQHETPHTLPQAILTVRRLLDLEPWHEETHRWLMELLAKDGQRSAALAHFAICKRVLWEELAVEPGAELQGLYRQLAHGTAATAAELDSRAQVEAQRMKPPNPRWHPPPADLPLAAQPLPHFLQNDAPAQLLQTPFVAREVELTQLDRHLALLCEGQGFVSFIIGEAGSGKTLLLREFTQRALHREPALIVATGHCNAYGGLGDPYLPFREIMAMLTGDVEARWRAGALSHSHATRLWRLLPEVAQVLLHHGPHLLESFLAGAALCERVAAACPDEPPWVTQLAALVDQRRTAEQQLSIDQSALFEMYTRVLQTIAQRHPLILILEDLHWADRGSLSLLFHLGRRLAGQRIWVIGAYRPHDLAMKQVAPPMQAEEPHPLAFLVHEFQQLFGNAPVDLNQSDGQHFVDSILKVEQHHLPANFRTRLFQHTQGHALFTTEMLRGMQARGDLIRDAAGNWIIGNRIDWRQLPRRVEGVISERINRLPTPLREVAEVASVMGEALIAEVIARVLRWEERMVVRQLSMLLERQHDLIQSQGNTRHGEQQLSHYRFRHVLFQHYLYHHINEGERAYLHEDIGHALEQLYQSQTDQVAVQLAHHFQAAGLWQKAIHYLTQAGRQATGRYAYREAIGFFEDALRLLEHGATSEVETRQVISLQLALAEASFNAGAISQALAAFQEAADLAARHHWTEAMVQAALGYEQVRYRFSLPAAPSICLLEAATAAVGEVESILKVRLLGHLAQAVFYAGQHDHAEALLAQAIAMARQVDDAAALFDVLYVRALAYRQPEQLPRRVADANEMLRLADARQDQSRLLHVYAIHLIDHLEAGDIATADATLAVHTELCASCRQTFHLFVSLVLRAMRFTLAGDFAQGEQLAHQALYAGQQMQAENAEGIFGIQLFTIRREQDELRQLAPVIQHFIARNPDAVVWRPGLALCYCDMGQLAEARAQFEVVAADNFAALPRDALWTGTLVYLCEVCTVLSDQARAVQLSHLLQPYAEQVIVVSFGISCLGAAAHYLARLATVLGEWSTAASYFETALRLNGQLQARPRLAHTQVQYAHMLLDRAQVGDRARAVALLNDALEPIETFGLKLLAGQVEALRQQYFARHS